MGTVLSIMNYCTRILTPFRDEGPVFLEKSAQADHERDPNAALAKELRGQRMHVDMTKSFARWPSGARHPEYERLRRETDRVLEM